jgi:hypothetical protein
MEGGHEAPVRADFAAQVPDRIDRALPSHLGFAKAPGFFVQDLPDAGEIRM